MFGPIVEKMPHTWQPQVIRYPLSTGQEYAQLVDFILPQLPESQPFILIAESFAGPLALQISTHAGANLNALVLSTTFLRNPRPRLSGLAPLLLREGLLARRPPKWLLRLLVTGFDADAHMLADLLAILREIPPRVLLQRLRVAMAVDVSTLFLASKLPVLHLYGRRDHLVPASASRAFQALRPDIPNIGIDGPHFLLQTRPQECMAVIRAFLLNAGVPA